ncbi:MAG: DMT family transporter [Janthinobacterium lividum]
MTRLILLLAVFLVSTAGLFAHQALTGATPLAIAAWRLGLAAVFFIGLSAFRRGESHTSPISPAIRWRLALAGLCLAAHFVTWFAALDRTSVARATLLACTTPLWTTLGSFILGRRRPSARDLAALAVAGFGLWLVTQTSIQTATHATFLGDIFGLSAGLLFGSYLLCVEDLHETISSQRQVTVAYSVAAAGLWVLLLARGGVTLAYSSSVWRALLGMTLGPQIFGHTLLNWSLRHFSSSRVAFSILLEPVIAAVLAWYLLEQALTLTQIFGGVLVLAALALVIGQRTPDRHKESRMVG